MKAPNQGAYVYRSQRDDALLLAPFLRDEDVDEVRAATGQSPLAALLHGVTQGISCWTIADSDGPVGMFGVCPGTDDSNRIVWLLASPRLLNHRRQLIRESRTWLRLLSGGRALVNYVDARNKVHVRFLQWLGASFGPPVEINGILFKPFLCVPQQPSH
jgi:hypothetical protein